MKKNLKKITKNIAAAPVYKVRYVNPQKQYKDHRKEFLNTVDSVFSRGDLINRGDLAEFEKKIAKMVGVKYAIGVNSGTDALSLSMQAGGLKPGDEVITAGYTFMASVSAIHHHGAKAVLVDPGPDFNINCDLIEQFITPKTVAIEPVHMNGRVCDMDKIMALAKKHNLMVFEDAARALGAKFKTLSGSWKMAGSFGTAGCFSMYPFKMLGAFGDAGVVTTNDPEIARKVRMLRYNGEDRDTRVFYLHGRTALLDNLQAALLNVKLKYFPAWVRRRREIAGIYSRELKGISEINAPVFDNSRNFDVWQNYVIRAQRRDDLVQHLAAKGVETLIEWDVSINKQPVMLPNEMYLPETEKTCAETVLLPMYPELTDSQVKYASKCVRDFYYL